jgi:hypothetical protein
MSPLELEIYHQMRNVIGIDPAFYEYIFTVDADTVRSFSSVFSYSLLTHLLDRDSGVIEPTCCMYC